MKYAKVFERLRAKNVAANPKKIKLGIPEVECVCHLVLDYPQPMTQKEPYVRTKARSQPTSGIQPSCPLLTLGNKLLEGVR